MPQQTQRITSEEVRYFAMIPNMADDELTVYEYRLYGHYRRVVGDSGNKCLERTRTTAQKLGISPSTVVKARYALQDKGYIRLESRRLHNYERLDVILCDIWPQNMQKYSATVREANGTDREANATVRPVVRIKNNPSVKEKPFSEEKPFVRSELTGETPGTNERTNESISLLTDESILMSKKDVINKLVERYSFQEIRAFCSKFILEGKIPGTDAGLIAYWLEAADTIPPARRDDFYYRHRTPTEIAEAEQAEAKAAEENRRWEERQAELSATRPAQPAPSAPQPQAQPADRDAKTLEVWQMTLNELSLSMPAPTFETWLKGTTALGYTDGEFVVGVSDAYARDWLSNRLRPQIKRILGRLCQRSIEVTFQVRERPAEQNSQFTATKEPTQ
jgi:DNA-binding Lrp family transcriptional regulator